MKRRLQRATWISAGCAGLIAAAVSAAPTRVHACGGLFCSATNPVNQAAEQIIFSKNTDGSVTAVIQIMYEGPSQKFAWVLPVEGVPDVAVSSDQAFVALKQATNPQYNLTTMFDGSCGARGLATPTSAGAAPRSAADNAGSPGVTVQASGAIGPYDYDVISVDPKLADPAQTAVDWLTQHSYDVGPMGDKVLKPYLADGENLIAFKLTKESSTGSIRPIMITYNSELPAIPIRPTAVAANDNMGVLVWVLGASRAIPQNYKALELNEALINWFNPNSNYNDVVSKAADQAKGQGFVTEYAAKTTTLKTLGVMIFSTQQQQQWDSFKNATHTDALSLVRDASTNWGMWDGFDDALSKSVTLPTTIAPIDFKRCVGCYINDPGVMFDAKAFIDNLEKLVIKPMADTQALIDSLPYVTRLYTTMSADEMTDDPAFDFNPDLKDVSNVHTATQYLSCTTNGTQGPFRVVLPQGDEVRGTMVGTWPVNISDQPAALKVLEYGKAGQGKVVDDQSANVTAILKKAGTGTAGSSASGSAGKSGSTTGSGGSSSTEPGTGDSSSTSKTSSGCGCSVKATNLGDTAWPALLALASLALSRRRYCA